MGKQLKTQLKNSNEIREVLRKHSLTTKLPCGETVETLLVYLPCKNGTCDHSELLELIKNSLLTNFTLTIKEIENKLSIKSDSSPEDLFKKAVRKISKHTAKGELGELLLFTLLEVYFQAPKLLSKISLKTSVNVAVFGSDAVHAQYVDNSLRLYLGESKLRKNYSNAATSAASSISSSLDKYRDEFDLIDSHIDFPEMDDQIRDELISLLNPFSDENTNTTDFLYTPCFIGFTNPEVFSDDSETYKAKYIELANNHITDFFSKLAKTNSDIKKTTLILLPFSSIDSLTSEFITQMGIL